MNTATTGVAVARLVDAAGARRSGSGWMAVCPAHEDQNPSLSISEADGRALVHCHAGCETGEVLAALHMGMTDLYDEPQQPRDPERWLPRDLTWVDAYDYTDAEGALVFQVIRARKPNHSKTFLQRQPDRSARSGWAWNLDGLSAERKDIPYRLPALGAAIKRGESVWIAEGEKDAEALVAAGVAATCNRGGASENPKRPKWTSRHAAHLRGAACVTVVQDKDVTGRAHGAAVVASLEGVVGAVRLVEAQEGKDAADHLAAGHGLDDFVEVHADTEPREEPTQWDQESAEPTVAGRSSWYETRPGGLYLVGLRESRDGEPSYSETRLTNFGARIVASTEVDDGSEVMRRLDLEATVAGRTRRCSISASEFSRMDWVVPTLGPSAVLEAGRGIKDHARAAIQSCSEPVEVQVYGQTGWRESEPGVWVYLHAGGAVGATGPVEGIEVDLPGALAGYELPKPGGLNAIQASLSMLSVGPDRLTIPLLAAVYRAPLGGADMAVGIHGMTGIGKSELAALGQQHYGATLDARALPASWSSTANALEEQAFLTAEALLTVDDFCPSGSPRDVDRLHATADRLIRGAGNGAGRGRMAKDGSLRATRPSRGLILTTGEEVPRGQSLRARMMTLEVRRGDMNWESLTVAQQHAAQGTYAAAMSTYIAWLAPRVANVRALRGREIADLRGQVTTAHRRTATGIASLAWGWQVWLAFATEAGAITDVEQADLWQRGWSALLEAAEAASASVGETDPTRRFLALLGSAISSGRAHVASRKGGCPPIEPGAWGWRYRDGVAADMGQRVGWTEDGDLWLDPEAAYAAARSAGEGLTIDIETLRSRLSESGLLQSTDPGGKTGVRVRIEGRQRRVLHLSADALGDREEVRHPGVSTVSRGVSARETLSHPRDTPVSQFNNPSEQEELTYSGGETPETPWSHHVMTETPPFEPLKGLTGPKSGLMGPLPPAHGGQRDSRVTGRGGAA